MSFTDVHTCNLCVCANVCVYVCLHVCMLCVFWRVGRISEKNKTPNAQADGENSIYEESKIDVKVQRGNEHFKMETNDSKTYSSNCEERREKCVYNRKVTKKQTKANGIYVVN